MTKTSYARRDFTDFMNPEAFFMSPEGPVEIHSLEEAAIGLGRTFAICWEYWRRENG